MKKVYVPKKVNSNVAYFHKSAIPEKIRSGAEEFNLISDDELLAMKLDIWAAAKEGMQTSCTRCENPWTNEQYTSLSEYENAVKAMEYVKKN